MMSDDIIEVTHLLGKKLDEPIVITWKSKTENGLKRCPFCGGEAGVDIGNYGGMVCYCKQCFSQGKQCKTEAEAIEAWNRRTKGND